MNNDSNNNLSEDNDAEPKQPVASSADNTATSAAANTAEVKKPATENPKANESAPASAAAGFSSTDGTAENTATPEEAKPNQPAPAKKRSRSSNRTAAPGKSKLKDKGNGVASKRADAPKKSKATN